MGDTPRYGMAIDLNRCVGCHSCTVACKAENRVPLGVWRCWLKEVEEGRFPRVRRWFFPFLCNQCQNPQCYRICPTRAIHIRPDGIVDIDPRWCIGCRACMQACPYSSIFIDPLTGTAEKCNFCAHRLEMGLEPACVAACPTHARVFGDLLDSASEVSATLRSRPTSVRRPEKGTRPKVFYLGLDNLSLALESPAPPFYRWAEKG